MKGFSLKDHCPIVEPILCIALTEEKGKFMIAGLKKGHIFLYNRSKGGKKLIQMTTKKSSDIVAICDLELLDSKFFLI
jgi:hypothetical protein